MGTAHLTPSGTRRRHEEIIEYKAIHTDLNPEIPDRDYTLKETEIRDFFTENYGFKAPIEGVEWINKGRGVSEKVLASTRHGVELRTKYHPSGTTQYFYLVVTTGEFNQENLGIQHLQKYYEELKKQVEIKYGKVRKRTSRWTSRTVEV